MNEEDGGRFVKRGEVGAGSRGGQRGYVEKGARGCRGWASGE